MELQQSTYHSLLRISSVVVAIMLAFVSGLFSPVTSQLADTTEQYLANVVGVTVGVLPTELNTKTAELTARERALEARELAVAEREIAVTVGGGGVVDGMRTDTLILATILFILLVLIVINYVLDFTQHRTRFVSQ